MPSCHSIKSMICVHPIFDSVADKKKKKKKKNISANIRKNKTGCQQTFCNAKREPHSKCIDLTAHARSMIRDLALSANWITRHNDLSRVAREKGSSDFPLNHSFIAHAQPLSDATWLVLWLKFSLALRLTWANSTGYGETARMRSLAWTFAVRIC